MGSKTDDDPPLPPEGLLTSEDLFGDLVDAPSPSRPTPSLPLRAPIRVQVSEPGSPLTGPFEPGLKPEPLAKEVAALLEAFPGGDEVRESGAGDEARPPSPAPVPAASEPGLPERPPQADVIGGTTAASREAESRETGRWPDVEKEGLLDALALTLDRPRFPAPSPDSLVSSSDEPPAVAEGTNAATESEAAQASASILPTEAMAPLAGSGVSDAAGAVEMPATSVTEAPLLPAVPEIDKQSLPALNPQDVDHLLGVMGSLRTAPRLEARYSPGGDAGQPIPAAPETPAVEQTPAEAAALDLAALAKDAFAEAGPAPEQASSPAQPPADPSASDAGPHRTGERGAETESAADHDAADSIYGPYRLLERVAVGGMAEVFRAKRSGVEGFEKVLAVKRILPHLSDNKEFVDMFIDEAKMVAGLSHPNIVQIFDLGRLDKSYYIAMDYVHGRDLRTILRRGKERGLRVPLDLSVLVVSEICTALDYAHRRKDDRGRPLQIVHRDISPQNILISFDGDVKLTDFGIAKAASKAATTDHGTLRGKLLYMSPEQAGGRTMDRRSDIFSLGIVFYEMITDQKPFLGTSEMSILETVRECRVAAPTQLNPRIPEKLERVVMKALARDPEQRYQDGADMHRDLERVLHERQAPTAVELARFMEILFDPEERGAPPADEASLGEGHHGPEHGGLEMEFEGVLPEEPPAPEPQPAKEALSLHRLLKRFGIR